MPDDTDDDVLSDGTPARHYRRRSEELEFDRVAFFSDAVFAIAMTLLVVGIGIPKVKEGGDLGEALSSKDAEIFSFFLSFVVIGFFWLAHHRFFAGALLSWLLIFPLEWCIGRYVIPKDAEPF